MRRIILIIHNVRSAYNVGALLRTADGLGIDEVVFSGYTPYPPAKSDIRLPHIAQKAGRAIRKTALGAEDSVKWQKTDDILNYIKSLVGAGWQMAALEQTSSAINLSDYQPPSKIALLVGSEIGGLEPGLLKAVPIHLEIPMLGTKESLNVAAAGAIALYHLRYTPVKGLDKRSA
jgi:23S rRNA (guanosine2251-2'-O)-methyltransferase